MSKKSLIETNPYLQNSKQYEDSLITNVSSSTAVETGEIVETISEQLRQSTITSNIFEITSDKKQSNSQ